MIMKNIFKIHPLLCLLMFICIITGLFRELMILEVVLQITMWNLQIKYGE